MTIDIIVSSNRDLRPFHHIRFLTEIWQNSGHQVRTVQAFSDEEPADVGFLHIDLTHIDAGVVEWGHRYATLINQFPTDISKRRISTNLVSHSDKYEGPVIIKTDLNRGGKPEFYREKRRLFSDPAELIRRELARRGAWRFARTLPPNDYPVMDRKSDVPDWVWSKPEFVVEKFLPERQDGLYVSRIWVFLGDQEYGRVEMGESPTGRGARAVRKMWCDEIPDSIRAFRSSLKMDYGKIDWAMGVDGPEVFDANRTPSRVTVPVGEDLEVMKRLAGGIKCFA